jgi:hypothetical protein
MFARVKILTGLLLALFAGSALAQNFVTPDAFGWSRGDAATSYYEWDDFSTATGLNAPDIASFPSPLPVGWVEPSVLETTGTGFLTSTGNIYAIEHVLEFEINIPAEPVAAGTTTVVVQTRTQGREIDPLTMICNGVSPVETVELYRLYLGPDGIGGGSIVETLWRFEVPADGALTIVFAANGESLSFDRVSVDTFSVEADCLADVNGDGSVTPTDFTAWIAAFNTNAPACDQNGDGTCSSTDFTAWIANYNNGC